MSDFGGVPDPSSLLHTSPEIASAYRRSSVRSGDVVVSIGPSFGKVMIVPPELEGANLTQGTARVAPSRGASPRYLYWALQSRLAVAHWDAAVGGATFRALNLGPLGETPVPVWSLPRQQSIADYLDTETARIDSIVAARSSQAALVEERRVSMLSRLLVPEGAAFLPLRRLAVIQSGLTVDALREVTEDAVTRPYLRVANVQPGRLELDSVTEITVPSGLAERCTLRDGDVLMTEGGDLDKLGRGAIWRGELPGALHQNHIFAVRPLPELLDPEYLGLLTQTALARAYFESTGVKTTNLASTNREKIMSLPIPRLSVLDQRTRVAEARARLDRMTAFQGCLRSQADLLHERRQALVTASVTGQIEIPGVAA